ncbi:MAG: GatB/YqeY domain-containing protein [Flavobacteriales bacterium]|nr:GatB/YqeY domain-containing protein [Flavobacteriales bacterium]
MTLQERIENDIKDAMKARDKDRLNALRAIKSAILLELTKEGGASFSEEAGLRMLQKLHKQRSEAAAIFHQQGRADLANEEEAQAKVIGAYLPARMDEGQLQESVLALIGELGAAGMGDMGRVIKTANERLAGRADGGAIASMVKRLLAARGQ